MKEPHEQVKNGNVLRFIKDYWFIIAFIVTAAFAWSELRSQVQANGIVNDKQQVQIEALGVEHHILEKKYIEDVSVIKTKLDQLTN